MHYQPQLDDPALATLYREECAAHGHEPGIVVVPVPGPATVFCAEDPDQFWDRYGHHLLADARGYREWHAGDDRGSFVQSDALTVDELRAEGVYLVATPDDLVRQVGDGELGLISTHPLCGGIPLDAAWESMRLLGERVLPRIRCRPAAGGRMVGR